VVITHYWDRLPVCRCEGHFLYVPIPDQKEEVVICEGLQHFFAKWSPKAPKGGAAAAAEHFVGTGCLGTGSSIMRMAIAAKATELESELEISATAVSEPSFSPSSVILRSLGFTHDEATDPSHYYASRAVTGTQIERRCTGHSGERHGVRWGRDGVGATQPLVEPPVGVDDKSRPGASASSFLFDALHGEDACIYK